MKVIAINGSPRKRWNTHMLLDDYSKYAMTYFDGAKRLKRRQTQFLLDCQKAYDLGVQLCTPQR